MGILLLEGGCEFQGKMEEPDRKALALAGGENAGVVIIPTAAAQDNNHERAGNNALRWFRGLGARSAVSLPIIDRASANDPEFSSCLNRSDFIYMLGGFPGYLENTLKESLCLAAIRGAYQRGAVLAGSSAGGMVLCEQYFDPADNQLKNGFGFQKKIVLIPHHDTFGSTWRDLYLDDIQDALCVGIDEQTGMIKESAHDQWTVYGKGGVTVYREISVDYFGSGKEFRL